MEVDGGLDHEAITNKLVAGVTNIADKKLVNQINKWIEMVDMIYFTSESELNIYQQILYIKVITSFWIKESRSSYSKRERRENQEVQDITKIKFGTIRGHKHYQLLAGKNIATTERLLPIRFRIEHRATKIAYVTFNKRGGKNNEFFIDKNQILEELFRTDVGNENHDNSFSLEEISNHEKLLMPYIDYISTVVELYACL